MVGTQQLQNPKDGNGTLTTMKEQWQIHYSRFFNFPSLPSSTCPSLQPLYSRCKKDNPFGVWVSASSMASVQLFFDQCARGMLLTVTFKGKIYEEHYISKLVFSWPQVSCLEACPVRGSRVLFASYRDGLGQVQKFAMRFLAFSDAQTFMCFLKESLKDIRNIEIPRSKLESDVFPPEFISSTGIQDRAAETLSSASPVAIPEHQVQSLSNTGSLQYTCLGTTALAHDLEVACATLPPNFSALLSDSCTDVEQEPPTLPITHDFQMMSSSNHGSTQYIYSEATTLAHDSAAALDTLPPSISAHLSGSCSEAQQVPSTVPMPYDLSSQMRGCMTGSSFNDMLSKLEMAIVELGGDMSL